MHPRRSEQGVPSSTRLPPASRADSTSSSGTHGRRSKSADSTATDETALTPVPETADCDKSSHDDALDQADGSVVNEGTGESDALSAPRRSARTKGRVQHDHADFEGGHEGANQQRGTRKSAGPRGTEGSAVGATTYKRRPNGRFTSKGADDDDEDTTASPDEASAERSPSLDEDDPERPEAGKVGAGPTDSSPLTSAPDSPYIDPPDVKGGSSTRRTLRKTLVDLVEADEEDEVGPADELGVDELGEEPSLERPKPRARPIEPTSAASVVTRKRAVSVKASLSKRRRILAPLSVDDWFEVVIRRDPYAVVSATATTAPQKRSSSPSYPLSPLSIARHDGPSRSSFTVYRFSLATATGKQARVEDVTVRLEGSDKKVPGYSARAGAGRAKGGGTEGGHWVLVIKRHRYKWVAPS